MIIMTVIFSRGPSTTPFFWEVDEKSLLKRSIIVFFKQRLCINNLKKQVQQYQNQISHPGSKTTSCSLIVNRWRHQGLKNLVIVGILYVREPKSRKIHFFSTSSMSNSWSSSFTTSSILMVGKVCSTAPSQHRPFLEDEKSSTIFIEVNTDRVRHFM